MDTVYAKHPDIDTVTKRLQHFSKENPDREILVFHDGLKREAFTASRLFRLAGKMAARLVEEGFSRGDVIANTLPNSPERAVTDLGILFAGCVPMNGQILLADGEDFFQSARKSRCKGVILCPESWCPSWVLCEKFVSGLTSGFVASMACPMATEMSTAILIHSQSSERSSPFISELENDAGEPYVDLGNPDDVACVFATSGSTGYSKIVPRTHFQLLETWGSMMSTIRRVVDLQPSKSSVMYNDRPFGWLGGYPYALLTMNRKRVCFDKMSSRSGPDEATLVKLMQEEKVTSVYLTSFELERVARYVEKEGGFEKVDLLQTGGQPVKKFQFESGFTLGKQFAVAYGCTECGPVNLYGLVKELRDFYCGKPVDGSEIRIVDDDGKAVGTGQIGSIQIKASYMFEGYFNRLEEHGPETEEVFTSDGFFKTGDNGYMDEEGDFFILGRSSDVIMHGDHLLYPAWLERKILDHHDVIECLVVAVSDPFLHHAICACVKVREESHMTEEDLKDFCKTLFITKDDTSMMPEYFKVLKGSEFPETSSGKPDKRKLRLWMEELFGRKL